VLEIDLPPGGLRPTKRGFFTGPVERAGHILVHTAGRTDIAVKGLQMNLIQRSRIAAVASVAIAAAILGGCTKKIPIVQYPVFWDRTPKTVAVTPFRNQTVTPEVGIQISNNLAAALAANGSYKVYDRSLLEPYLKEQELQRAFSSDSDVAAAAMVYWLIL